MTAIDLLRKINSLKVGNVATELARMAFIRAEAKKIVAREECVLAGQPYAPVCEECSEPMHRYGPALDTGKMGWQCDLCGWSEDD